MIYKEFSSKLIVKIVGIIGPMHNSYQEGNVPLIKNVTVFIVILVIVKGKMKKKVARLLMTVK